MKKIIGVILALIISLSAFFISGCNSVGLTSYDTRTTANCLIYTGYRDATDNAHDGYVDYYYDKDTGVMYACRGWSADSETITALYKADGSLVTYEEWLQNRNNAKGE